MIWYRILQNKNILEQEERTCWNPFESLQIIRRSQKKIMQKMNIMMEKLYEIREIPIYQRWDDKAKNDFQLIDLSITERALEIAGA